MQVFDLDATGAFGQGSPSQEQLTACRDIAACLQRTGCLLVKDHRVSSADNDRFLDTLEAYFSQPDEEKQDDIRAHLSYQVGLTPEGVERPRLLVDEELRDEAVHLQDPNTATLPTGPDVKCRFFWRCGPRPETTQYPELNAEPVIPKAFPQWREVMDGFGGRLLSVAHTVAECVALGLGLPEDALTHTMEGGPHLLAPTGSDLGRHGALGTVLAGYHSDLNMLTVHGKSRFPGLHVWLADGTRVAVKVPPGCLLVQAGQQLEWLTGGFIKAGRHEVVVTEDTRAAIAAAQQAGRPCWRVSSTVFVHVASDVILQPLGHFADTAEANHYPPTPAGIQVQRELETLALRTPSTDTGSAPPPQPLACNLAATPEQPQGLAATPEQPQVHVDVTLGAHGPLCSPSRQGTLQDLRPSIQAV